MYVINELTVKTEKGVEMVVIVYGVYVHYAFAHL